LSRSILYCGDTELNGAASYLAGLMTAWGWHFDYVPSHQQITPAMMEMPRSLLILSDFPSTQFDANCQQLAIKQIENGAGLLMIGGWESFHGFGGNWDGTSLGSVLPVEILTRDDRMNFDQSAWLTPAQDHPIISGLPWYLRPPAIGGMNLVAAKPDSCVVLNAQSFVISKARPADDTTADSTAWSFSSRDSFPALVLGEFGKGRTAAFMSDAAPHWVGGFVDWGMPRVTGQAMGGPVIEVGSDYAKFWKQLLQWTGKLLP
jgi:uncharacterized membrane protein